MPFTQDYLKDYEEKIWGIRELIYQIFFHSKQYG